MEKEQLELSLDGTAKAIRMPRHGGRRLRARWWFERMRDVVDRAFDWGVVPPPRPEQGHLALAPGRSSV